MNLSSKPCSLVEASMTKSLHFSGFNKQGRSIISVLLFICGLFKHILQSNKAVYFPERQKKHIGMLKKD